MVFALKSYGTLIIAGADAAQFLQGQLTCNVKKLQATQLAAHCAPNGRIQSLFFISQIQDQFYLMMPIEMLEIASKQLKKYAIFFKVTISIDTETRIAATAPPDLNVQRDATATNLLDEKNWQIEKMQFGIPMVYASTSNLFLPHELNLPQLKAVAFDKGCFTGQEIIARTEYKGKIKKSLRYATLDCAAEIKPGAIVEMAGAPSATIVESVKIESNRYAVLILLDQHLDLNQPCLIAGAVAHPSFSAFRALDQL